MHVGILTSELVKATDDFNSGLEGKGLTKYKIRYKTRLCKKKYSRSKLISLLIGDGSSV